MKAGEFDDVLSDVIEDTKIAKSLKLRKVYEADTKSALNSTVLLEGEEDPVVNAIKYFNGDVDKLDHTWTLLAQLYPNKGPLKLAHDRLVKLGKIKPIPGLIFDADVKVLDSPLLNQKNNATKTIIAADNGITNSENYNEMLTALQTPSQVDNGGINAIKDPSGNYVTELPLGKPLSEHSIQEVFGLVQAGYTNIGLYDMTPAALKQVFTDNINQIDFTKPFDEKAQSKILMARLYHKANNQHLFGNADTSYRRLMEFTEEQIEKYEKLIEEIPPFMRLNTLYGPAAKEAINQKLIIMEEINVEYDPTGFTSTEELEKRLEEESIAQDKLNEAQALAVQQQEEKEQEQIDPRMTNDKWGLKAFAKEGQSILTGGIQDTISSSTTFAERTFDAVTGRMQEEKEQQGYYRPDWDPFVDEDDPIITKTWWGKLLRGTVHFGSLAAGIVLSAKGLAAAGIPLLGAASTKMLGLRTVTRAMAIGGISDLISKESDGHNALGALTKQYGWMDTPLTTKDTDHPMMMKFKNIVEGMGIGLIFDGAAHLIGGGKQAVRNQIIKEMVV